MSDPKPPSTLGSFLRSAREKRGLTLEQIAAATKINIKLLQALEEDKYEILPAKPFVRGFVAAYTRYLELDAQEVLTEFKDYLNERSQERPSRATGHEGYAFEDPSRDRTRIYLWSIMGTFAVAGAIILLVFKPQLKRRNNHKLAQIQAAASATPVVSVSPLAIGENDVRPEERPDTSAELAAAKVVAAAAAKPTPSPKPSPKPTPAPTPSPSPTPSATADALRSGKDIDPKEVRHKLVFKAKESVWIRYQVDQKDPIQYILRKDLMLVLRAKDVIRFQTANPTFLLIRGPSFNYTEFSDSSELQNIDGVATASKPRQDDESIKKSLSRMGKFPSR